MPVKGLENWKKEVGAAKEVHQENENARRERTVEDRLRHAMENVRSQENKKPETPKTFSEPPARNLKSESQPVKADSKPIPQTAQPTQLKESVRTKTEVPRPQVYQNPIPSSVPTNTNNPATRAASHFVLPTPQPQLADLLLKRSNTPPAPPKANETKQTAEVKNQSEMPQQAQAATAAKVQAPIASDAGAKLADTTHKRGENEVGKKKKEGKETKSSEGSSKTVATQNSRLTTHDSRLEAASSGVAGGNGEPIWVADLPPIGYTVNPGSKLDESGDAVRERAEKFKKYVEQPKVAAVMARGVELSQRLDELFDQVKKNIPPKNSYGVVRG